jgi:hypothetical protein
MKMESFRDLGGFMNLNRFTSNAICSQFRSTLRFTTVLCAFIVGGQHTWAEPIAESPINANDSISSTYLEATAYLAKGNPVVAQAYSAMVKGLLNEFNTACPAALCKVGRISSYQALSFQCSVSSDKGQIENCLFHIASSFLKTNERSGRVEVDSEKFFRCQIGMNGTVGQFIHFMDAEFRDGPQMLTSQLPGEALSIMEQLKGCLN